MKNEVITKKRKMKNAVGNFNLKHSMKPEAKMVKHLLASQYFSLLAKQEVDFR